jgi:peptidoglycan/LPS O-acetylase OafA/YrhL
LNNKGIASQADIMAFFRKRAKRIYPLYWVALALNLVAFFTLVPLLHVDISRVLATFPSGVGTYDSFSSVVIIFLGAQGLLYPRFIGLEGNWFIGTILICYLLYPIIAYFGKNNALRIILVSIAVFCGLLVVYFTLNVVGDARLYTYFGIFVAGIIASRANLFRSGAVEKRIAAPCALILAFLILAQAVTGVPSTHYFGLPLEISLNYAFNYAAFLIWYDAVALLIVVAACYVAQNRAGALSKRGAALFFFVATGSYAIFLFHGQFIVGLRLALEKVPQISIAEITLIVLCIGLPALFIVAFYEQRIEPEIVNKLLAIAAPSNLWRRWRAFLRRS